MHGDEGAAFVFGRKGTAPVKHDLKRRGVGLKEHVRYGHFVFDVLPFTPLPWVLMSTDIVPRPAVNTPSFTDVA